MRGYHSIVLEFSFNSIAWADELRALQPEESFNSVLSNQAVPTELTSFRCQLQNILEFSQEMRQGNFTLVGSDQNDSSGSTREEIVISPLGRWLLVSVLAATAVVVFIGNVLVLIVLHKQRRIAGQRVINMFLANLALIDLSVSFAVLPLSMATYIHGSWPFGETFCEINGFMTMIIGISGILTMTAIAIDR